jgi:hypothetical protein
MTDTRQIPPPYWQRFPAHYRAQEIQTLVEWIVAGESGAAVGISGTGRATLLNYLCQRPDVLRDYLPKPYRTVYLVPLDLNNLPESDLATLYRVILRAFQEHNGRFEPDMQTLIETIYRRCETAQDPFIPQSGLRELMLAFQAEAVQVVLVINRFDRFCETATHQMTNTLRGLRDSFKSTLTYIMGMRQEVIYLSALESSLPLRGLLDTHVCWIRPLNEKDGRFMIQNQIRQAITDEEIAHLLALTGGYPSLLRAVCLWYQTAVNRPPREDWASFLIDQPNIEHRLSEIWQGLNLEEQALLEELTKATSRRTQLDLVRQQENVLHKLAQKGVCATTEGVWYIVGDCVAAYASRSAASKQGRLRYDEDQGAVYQGRRLVDDLSPQETAVLRFLLRHPHQRHSHNDLLDGAWPDGTFVSQDALYQAIRGIRKKVEPNSSLPNYVITWRSQTDGGYQLFPEGRPN